MSGINFQQLAEMKKNGEKISVLTAYDYSSALLADREGIDIILVGDSLGMVVLGYEATVPVTMEEMLHHTKAVTRGAQNAMIVVDMPFMSYHVSTEQAITNAGKFIKEAGAQAVKLEGGGIMVERVRAIVAAGIPVMAHLGLTPQTAAQLGGFKVQGREEKKARQILQDALELQEAGAFSLVLECVPQSLAARVTRELSIPTIGIGAGADCDGQVLVYHDLLGLFDRFTPKFVKRYANLGDEAAKAIRNYKEDVKTGKFPAEEHCFK